MFRLSLAFFIVQAFCTAVQAQVSLIGLGDHNPVLHQTEEQRERLRLRRGPVCPVQPHSLPFFDDFARLDSFYPNCQRWLDNQVFLNGTMAHNPPSIGTATFDGLNPFGEPYNRALNTSMSYSADTLTSQPLDLSSKTANSRLVLSYFLQPQGLCDRPEAMDSMYLEFLRSDGQWTVVRGYPGVANNVSINIIPDFFHDKVYLSDTSFFHANFQFRFRNRATITGNNDHWHLDYVYLDENRDTAQSSRYPDVAYTRLPLSPFKGFTALPWRHFQAGLWQDSLALWQQNHGAISGTLDRLFLVTEPSSGTTLLNKPLPALTYAPSPNANDAQTGIAASSFGSFAPTEATVLCSEYRILNPTDFQNNPLFAENDTVRRYTVLDDYFAYDDGTAETRIIAQGIGTKIAVEYMPSVNDTLWGIYFHLPHFTNRDAQLDYVNVKVWLGALTNEVFSKDIYRLRYVSGFNGWHYMALTDFADQPSPIALQANERFYIGWQQASSTPVPLGFDRNSDARPYTWVAPGGGNWAAIDLEGAVMMRPVVGLTPPPVSQIQIPQLAELRAYPNPTSEFLYVELSEGTVQGELCLYNALGQLVQQNAIEGQQTKLQLHALPSGYYHLVHRSPQGQWLGQTKIIKR